jgi:hypothetical protein
MRALKKRPEERPQTASAFAQELLASVHNHPTIASDQYAPVEQSSEMSSLEPPRTKRKGGVAILLMICLILLSSVAAGFGPLRFFKNDKNRQQSTAPVVTKSDQAPPPAPQLNTAQPADTTKDDQAPPPTAQLNIAQPTNTTPAAPGEKTTPSIKTKPSLPVAGQPVRKNTVETRKRTGAAQKADPPKAVFPNRETYGVNRDRQPIYDDYDRYRRYRYNPYWPEYRDRFYMRRRFYRYYR